MAEDVCFGMCGLQFDVASSTDIPIDEIQAGLVLSQSYIYEQCRGNGNHANRTQISHLKQYIDNLTLFGVCLYQLWTNKPLQYISTPYNIYIYTVYIHFCTIYLFNSNTLKVRLASIVFCIVHPDRTVVVLLNKHFSS